MSAQVIDLRAHRPPQQASGPGDGIVDPLAEWAQWYRASGASPHTIRLRLTTMRQLMRHSGQDDPLQITSRQIIAWMATPMAPATRGSYRNGVKQFYAWCVRFELVARNPMDLVPTVKPVPGQPRPVEHQFVMAALATSRSWRCRAYLTIGYYAGCGSTRSRRCIPPMRTPSPGRCT